MRDHERLPTADRRTVLRSLGRLIAADRRTFGAALVLYLAAAAAGAALPVMLGRIIDGIGAGWTLSDVDRLGFLIIAFVVVQLVLTRYGRLLAYRFGERAAADLRERFTSHVLRLPLGQIERAGSGDLTTRTTGDVAAAANLLRETGPQTAVALLQIIVVYATAFAVNPGLGALLFVSTPVLFFAGRRYLRVATPVFLAERAAMGDTAETLTATTAGAATVDAYRMGPERGEEGRRTAAVHFKRLMGILRMQSWFFPSLDFAILFPVGVIVAVGSLWFLDGGPVTIGQVATVSMLALRLDPYVFGGMMSLNAFQEGGAALARIEGVSMVGDDRSRADAPGPEGVIMDEVVFGYGDGPDVLHGLSLEPGRGKRLVVVGPSGAGKSTIARLIAGIDRPRAGKVTVDGAPSADLELAALRKKVVLVTQEHYVFTASLRDNLRLADSAADDQDLAESLRMVGADWAEGLAEGLDTMIGGEHRELSITEAQQLALARVILADPEVVILDEATAGIDPGSAGNVEASLAAALHGRTVIAIAHQLQAAEAADRIAVVREGRIAEAGTHDELLAAGGAYADLWRAWKGVAA